MIILYQSGPGRPLNITSGVDQALSTTGSQRPNQVLGNPYTDRSGHAFTQWLNPAAFTLPALGTYGNVGFDSVVGPSSWNFSTALSRTFAVREAQHLEVRVEAFNPTNSFVPGNPSAALSSNTFGQIRTQGNQPRVLQFAMKYTF